MAERMTKTFLALVLAVVMSSPAVAETCSVTSLPTSGTITGARLNARLSQIESCINGGIDENNFTSGTNIPSSDLAAPKALYTVSFTLDCAAGTKAAAFVPYTTSTIVGVSTHVDATSTFDYDVTIKDDAVTVGTVASITTTTATYTALSRSVTNADEVIVDITQTTPGTCTAVNVVVFLTTAHVS